MTKEQKQAYDQAMAEARKLATLKRRKTMAPHVHEWAQAIKRMLARAA